MQTVTPTFFAKSDAGETVEEYTLRNSAGITAKIIDWGATLSELHLPDRNGKFGEVTCGYDDRIHLLRPNPFFGSTTGRFANRICKGKFTLEGVEYQLAVNNGPNHLHGGVRGIDKRIFAVEDAGKNSLRFTYVSPHLEEGFPGELTVSVVYTLTDANELRLDYTVSTDRPTIHNITNHTFWNLSGAPTILDHELCLHADQYVPIDETSIPLGDVAPVTPAMDFRIMKPIGRDLAQVSDQPGGGYDHNWAINGWETATGDSAPRPAAELYEPTTGRFMEVLTTEPGVQFYSGNYLNEAHGRNGRGHGRFSGMCLETQHFPDSPNQPKFPTTVLRSGEVYRSTTIHRFSTR